MRMNAFVALYRHAGTISIPASNLQLNSFRKSIASKYFNFFLIQMKLCNFRSIALISFDFVLLAEIIELNVS